MRHLRFSLALIALFPVIAGAQTAVDPEPTTMSDVAGKPLEDMNLKKDEIPPLLIEARANPYDLTGLRRCSAIAEAVTALDGVLGDDIDIVDALSLGEKRKNSAGNIGKAIIGSFIPFGGVIRELSGANAAQRERSQAIYAGSVRRAFLKGVGQQKGCDLPARAATPREAAEISAAREAERLAAEAAKAAEKKKD